MKKCRGIDINSNCCRGNRIDNTLYCKYHQYMKDYTEEMIKNLHLCNGCMKMKYINENSYCEQCKEFRKKINKERRSKKDKCMYVKDNGDQCLYKILTKDTNKTKLIDNRYCDKHQSEAWRKQTGNEGNKLCNNYKRGCDIILPADFKYSYCHKCRNTDKVRLRDFKKGANKRNIPNELTDNEILELMNKNCEYCDVRPYTKNANGIDRINNDRNEGYKICNVNSCCSICNKMKGTSTLDDFYKYCENIYENYPSNEMIDNRIYIKSYADIKYKANKRNIPFKITIDEYKSKMSKKCFYCCNTNGNKNGLDRIDSGGIYEINNTVPCCGTCNLMKNKHSLDDFINKIKIIVEKNKLIN